MLDEAHEPTLTNFVEKGSNVRVKNEVHLLAGDPDAQRIQRIVLSTTWSEPVAEPEEVLLVDAVQHGGGRSLDYLVFQGGHREWALSSVSLWYVGPARWKCPVCSSMDPRGQISEVSVKVCLVCPPRYPVHSGSGIAFEREECIPEQGDADVVEERGELLLLPQPCGLPYAIERL
jgi:hypothetical protein